MPQSNIKVIINALSARGDGAQTYLSNLMKCADLHDGVKIYIVAPKSFKHPDTSRFHRLDVRWPTDNVLLRYLWEKYRLPKILRKMGADVLFCPGGSLNTVTPGGCKVVTMFRNMLPYDRTQRAKYPIGFTKMRNWLLEKSLLRSMSKADLVIFVSEYATKCIRNKIGKKLRGAVTIPHGLSDHFKTRAHGAVRRPSWLPSEDYLLYVSKFEVYKNQLEVVRAFSLLKNRRDTKEKLVLAGRSSGWYGKLVRREIAALGLEGDIILPGDVSYSELPELYHCAKINIFASVCENCPNIMLEALGAGRPMLVSNKQPMPEFGGDAVIYYDVNAPNDLTEKMLSIIDDPDMLAELSKKAAAQSEKYDWRITAQLTWSVLSLVAKGT